MIDEIVGGCLETFGHWIFGVIFLIAASVVLFTIPASSQKIVSSYLSFLLFHTSAMLIVGFGFKQLQRFWVVSWCASLLVFLTVVTIILAWV